MVDKEELLIAQTGAVVRRARGTSKTSCAGCAFYNFEPNHKGVPALSCARKVPAEHVTRIGKQVVLDCVEMLFIYSEV